MPRLEGERSGGGVLTIILILVVLVIALLVLEYFGIAGINLIPGFGAQ